MSATFGRVTSPQFSKIVKKLEFTGQASSQIAEKAESESDTRNGTQFFEIQTAVQSVRSDLSAPQFQGLVSASRSGHFLVLVPIYLSKRTFRI